MCNTKAKNNEWHVSRENSQPKAERTQFLNHIWQEVLRWKLFWPVCSFFFICHIFNSRWFDIVIRNLSIEFSGFACARMKFLKGIESSRKMHFQWEKKSNCLNWNSFLYLPHIQFTSPKIYAMHSPKKRPININILSFHSILCLFTSCSFSAAMVSAQCRHVHTSIWGFAHV